MSSSATAEQSEEASALARKAMWAQEKALELLRAAAAVGDPGERQKLLNIALQKAAEAESFGKTAKWLASGSFQGFLAGSSMGSVPGVALGLLTGTLVGGLVTLITGGIGGAAGAGVGAVHGPFFKVGDILGGALGRVLPTIPGWTATEEQRRTLERMLGLVKEQAMPSTKQLQQMASNNPLPTADVSATRQATEVSPNAVDSRIERKRPRKIEVRQTVE